MNRGQSFGGPSIYYGQPGRNGLRCAFPVANLGDGHALVTFVEADKRGLVLLGHIDGCLGRAMSIGTLGNFVRPTTFETCDPRAG